MIVNINARQLRNLLENEPEKVEIIDVREPEEYESVHIKGSKLIPMNELVRRIKEINWNKEVVFVCRSGSRSAAMAKIADSSGVDVKNLQYGILECLPPAENFWKD